MLASRLDALLAQGGIVLPDQQKQQLLALVGLLHKWNKAYNLTSVRDPMDMLVKHIMDSDLPPEQKQSAAAPYLQQISELQQQLQQLMSEQQTKA